MALRLNTSLQYLKGVGPKLGQLFSSRGIETVEDLLQFYPRAFEDQRAARSISSLKADDIVGIKAHVISVQSIAMGRSTRKMYDVLIQDGTGRIHCKFFRVPYKGYFERFQNGKEVRVVGKVTNYRGRLEFHHPDIKDIEPDENVQDQVIPIYTEIDALPTQKISRLISSALEQIQEWPEEKIPQTVLKKQGLISKKSAYLSIHKPDPNQIKLLQNFTSEAHRRIIFDEFFWLELYLGSRKVGFQKAKSRAFSDENNLEENLIRSLPFQMTQAQMRVLKEIKTDLAVPHPMHRLVQGDVGSGKTLVCFLAALQVVIGGGQVALMAPTEILAEQHFRNADKVLTPLGVKVGLLLGKTKSKERKDLLAQLADGTIQFLIGTHALIEDEVIFKDLGLVIIDEQHRFGVEQRGSLKAKGLSPHFLVMTATPIPRTLAMTVYGDLDVSVIDEMPAGRSPIQTRATYQSKRPQAIQFMLDQVAKGRQAYVVYPLVEESEKIDLKDAVSEYEKLIAQYPQVHFGLLHGKMKSDAKDQVMERFRRNEIQVLVSTTVIEVGVDVPNANIMVIEHAERFGLSQLHQLRGRVGRGVHKSFCILIMGHAVSDESRTRVEFMEKTTDGFKVAEFDLETRGPGELMGKRQAGATGFKMANIVRDMKILQEARVEAFEILKKDPQLKWGDHAGLREELLREHGPAALASIA